MVGTRRLWSIPARVMLVLTVAVLMLAAPAGAAGPPLEGSGEGAFAPPEPGERIREAGASGAWIEERTLTGEVTSGPLEGELVQHVTGTVRQPANFVTFHGTAMFTGTIEGCGEEEHTLTLRLTGRGQANPPVTESQMHVVDQSSGGPRVTGQGTVSQIGADFTYDIRYVCH